jgi:hypothetical protein
LSAAEGSMVQGDSRAARQAPVMAVFTAFVVLLRGSVMHPVSAMARQVASNNGFNMAVLSRCKSQL